MRLLVLKMCPYALCSCLTDFIGVINEVDVETRAAAAEPWGTYDALVAVHDAMTHNAHRAVAIVKRRVMVEGDEVISVGASA